MSPNSRRSRAANTAASVCAGKNRYTTAGDARRALLAVNNRQHDHRRSFSKEGGPERTIYRCPICDGWHLSKIKDGKDTIRGARPKVEPSADSLTDDDYEQLAEMGIEL